MKPLTTTEATPAIILFYTQMQSAQNQKDTLTVLMFYTTLSVHLIEHHSLGPILIARFLRAITVTIPIPIENCRCMRVLLISNGHDQNYRVAFSSRN